MARKEHKNRIDRDLLHLWLWDHKKKNNIVHCSGSDLARTMKMSRHTPVRLFAELVDAGKLIKTRQGYQIVDPANF